MAWDIGAGQVSGWDIGADQASAAVAGDVSSHGALAAFIQRRAHMQYLRMQEAPTRRRFDRPWIITAPTIPDEPGFLEQIVRRRAHERALRRRDPHQRHYHRYRAPIRPSVATPTTPAAPGYLELIARRRVLERPHRVPIPRHRHFRRPLLPSVPPVVLSGADIGWLVQAARRPRTQRIRM